jgi:hypothetical protein
LKGVGGGGARGNVYELEGCEPVQQAPRDVRQEGQTRFSWER